VDLDKLSKSTRIVVAHRLGVAERFQQRVRCNNHTLNQCENFISPWRQQHKHTHPILNQKKTNDPSRKKQKSNKRKFNRQNRKIMTNYVQPVSLAEMLQQK